ncbi:MAG: hypothetical protein AB7O52_15625 [Planctomycetota bacterium]
MEPRGNESTAQGDDPARSRRGHGLVRRKGVAIFGFGKKKRVEEQRRWRQHLDELHLEREALHTELAHLAEKMNVQLKDKATDKSTTLARYPHRIVELKIQIDELDRKIKVLEERLAR